MISSKTLAGNLLPKLTDAELEQVYKGDNPDWLKGEVGYLLAVKYNDAGKFENARLLLEDIIRHYPNTSKRQEAGDLLETVERISRVDTGRIGLIIPLSGQFQHFGERALKGALLAAGIFQGADDKSFKIEVRVVPADIDAQAAAEAVRQMITEDNVVAIVGPIVGANALAAADMAEKYGVPLITLSPVAGLPDKGYYIFRNCLTKSQQVKALLDWQMEERKTARFGIMHPDDKYGTEFADLFQKEAVTRGAQVTKNETYPSDETDFRDQIAALRAQNAGSAIEALFIPDGWENVAAIAPQLLYRGFRTQLLGSSGWHSPKIFEHCKPSYLEGAVFVDLFAPEVTNKEFDDYKYKYQQAYGEDPTITDMQAYESTMVLINILKSKNITTRRELAEALHNLGDWTGPLGKLTVSPNGEFQHQLHIFKIEKGAFTVVR
jgi:branched-chain amino acid transport system substrate-binding protein